MRLHQIHISGNFHPADIFDVADGRVTRDPVKPKRNPPMKVEMLMHFYSTVEAFTPEQCRRSIAYVRFVKELLRDGLIERPSNEERAAHPGWAYRTTPKGAALVDAICNVPNPVEHWVIPS